MVLLGLIAGTLASEDLACISAGLLIREGRLGFVAGVAACALGILLGDVGLWAAGRLSRSVTGRWSLLSRWVDRLPVESTRQWLEGSAPLAMVASRFMPGSRLPLYVCAGAVGMSLRRFTLWTSIAVLVWTPILVCLAAMWCSASCRPAA